MKPVSRGCRPTSSFASNAGDRRRSIRADRSTDEGWLRRYSRPPNACADPGSHRRPTRGPARARRRRGDVCRPWAEGGVDPIVLAAAAAFGFVYVHPFEDGNGRLHRWLIHHVLAAGGLVPKEIVFPVSSVILDRIAEYRDVLESYSRPLLPLIDWEETDDHNVRVLNETAAYYRYFDATRHAEFLYACLEETIRTDLPEEVAYVEALDSFEVAVQRVVDLPERTLNLLVKFLDQNGGTLSGRARSGEFSALHEDDVKEIEAEYARTLGALGLGARPSPNPRAASSTPRPAPST